MHVPTHGRDTAAQGPQVCNEARLTSGRKDAAPGERRHNQKREEVTYSSQHMPAEERRQAEKHQIPITPPRSLCQTET